MRRGIGIVPARGDPRGVGVGVAAYKPGERQRQQRRDEQVQSAQANGQRFRSSMWSDDGRTVFFPGFFLFPFFLFGVFFLIGGMFRAAGGAARVTAITAPGRGTTRAGSGSRSALASGTSASTATAETSADAADRGIGRSGAEARLPPPRLRERLGPCNGSWSSRTTCRSRADAPRLSRGRRASMSPPSATVPRRSPARAATSPI